MRRTIAAIAGVIAIGVIVYFAMLTPSNEPTSPPYGLEGQTHTIEDGQEGSGAATVGLRTVAAGNVRVLVRSRTGHTPIDGATVRLGSTVIGTSTRHGTYDMVHEEGRYTASHPGFEAAEFVVGPQDTGRLLTVELLQLASLSGIVCDETGQAVPGADVSIEKLIVTDGRMLPNSAQQITNKTIATGQFLMEDVAPGLYRISCEKPGFFFVAEDRGSRGFDKELHAGLNDAGKITLTRAYVCTVGFDNRTNLDRIVFESMSALSSTIESGEHVDNVHRHQKDRLLSSLNDRAPANLLGKRSFVALSQGGKPPNLSFHAFFNGELVDSRTVQMVNLDRWEASGISTVDIIANLELGKLRVMSTVGFTVARSNKEKRQYQPVLVVRTVDTIVDQVYEIPVGTYRIGPVRGLLIDGRSRSQDITVSNERTATADLTTAGPLCRVTFRALADGQPLRRGKLSISSRFGAMAKDLSFGEVVMACEPGEEYSVSYYTEDRKLLKSDKAVFQTTQSVFDLSIR